jgi:hypothetical protein
MMPFSGLSGDVRGGPELLCHDRFRRGERRDGRADDTRATLAYTRYARSVRGTRDEPHSLERRARTVGRHPCAHAPGATRASLRSERTRRVRIFLTVPVPVVQLRDERGHACLLRTLHRRGRRPRRRLRLRFRARECNPAGAGPGVLGTGIVLGGFSLGAGRDALEVLDHTLDAPAARAPDVHRLEAHEALRGAHAQPRVRVCVSVVAGAGAIEQRCIRERRERGFVAELEVARAR